jgi:hypothetical protein
MWILEQKEINTTKTVHFIIAASVNMSLQHTAAAAVGGHGSVIG